VNRLLVAGQLIGNRYELDHRIAVGGMGEVWEAADNRLGRSVAVKILRPELSGDEEFLHRFRIEARTVASLDHDSIARVHDYGEDSDSAGRRTAYLVMELVRGEPLSAVVARGPIDPDETLRIVEQAAWALHAAHERGFVHRDVKPGNILVADDGRVKLTDFGIAKAANAAPVTRAGMVMGTAHYIAPEQATGGEAGPTGDVYSLGIVGYECLAGQRPFRGDNAVDVAAMQVRDTPPPLPATVPVNVRTLIGAVLVKDPARRYATGEEFALAVAAVRRGERAPLPSGVRATTEVSPPPVRPPRKRLWPRGVMLRPAAGRGSAGTPAPAAVPVGPLQPAAGEPPVEPLLPPAADEASPPPGTPDCATPDCATPDCATPDQSPAAHVVTPVSPSTPLPAQPQESTGSTPVSPHTPVPASTPVPVQGDTPVPAQDPVLVSTPASTPVPAQDLPAQELPAQELPAQELPAQELPAQDLPAQELPAQDLPAQDPVPVSTPASTPVPARTPRPQVCLELPGADTQSHEPASSPCPASSVRTEVTTPSAAPTAPSSTPATPSGAPGRGSPLNVTPRSGAARNLLLVLFVLLTLAAIVVGYLVFVHRVGVTTSTRPTSAAGAGSVAAPEDVPVGWAVPEVPIIASAIRRGHPVGRSKRPSAAPHPYRPPFRATGPGMMTRTEPEEPGTGSG